MSSPRRSALVLSDPTRVFNARAYRFLVDVAFNSDYAPGHLPEPGLTVRFYDPGQDKPADLAGHVRLLTFVESRHFVSTRHVARFIATPVDFVEDTGADVHESFSAERVYTLKDS